MSASTLSSSRRLGAASGYPRGTTASGICAPAPALLAMAGHGGKWCLRLVITFSVATVLVAILKRATHDESAAFVRSTRFSPPMRPAAEAAGAPPASSWSSAAESTGQARHVQTLTKAPTSAPSDDGAGTHVQGVAQLGAASAGSWIPQGAPPAAEAAATNPQPPSEPAVTADAAQAADAGGGSSTITARTPPGRIPMAAAVKNALAVPPVEPVAPGSRGNTDAIRMVIKEGRIDATTPDVDATTARVQAEAIDAGGYVEVLTTARNDGLIARFGQYAAAANVSAYNGSATSVSITLRVPVDAFEGVFERALALVGAAGGKILARNANARDVTHEYADNAAREAVDATALAQMQELMRGADKTADVLAFSREMEQISSRLQAARNKRRLLTGLASMASLRVELSLQLPSPPPPPPVEPQQPRRLSAVPGWTPMLAFQQAAGELAAAARVVVDISVYLGVYIMAAAATWAIVWGTAWTCGKAGFNCSAHAWGARVAGLFGPFRSMLDAIGDVTREQPHGVRNTPHPSARPMPMSMAVVVPPPAGDHRERSHVPLGAMENQYDLQVGVCRGQGRDVGDPHVE